MGQKNNEALYRAVPCDCPFQGSEWVLAKKSEKRVMPSSVGDARGLLKEESSVWFFAGGSGGPPPENF